MQQQTKDQIAAEIYHYHYCLGQAITRMDKRATSSAGDVLNILSVVQCLLEWAIKPDIPEGVAQWNLQMCRKHLGDIQENYPFLRNPAPDLHVSFTVQDLLDRQGVAGGSCGD